MNPYYSDSLVTLYHGRMEQIIYDLPHADAVITDPPYGETVLKWDAWPHKWPTAAAMASNALWCFGSMRLLAERWDEFETAGWTFSQDIVWEKHNGSGFATDRFRRVHEHATHWYQGPWKQLRHEVPKGRRLGRDQGKRAVRSSGEHLGTIDGSPWVDDGTRFATSVIYARSTHGRAIHPTEKPGAILAPLIEYSVPVGGLVIDPFAGSASTLLTARQLGRRAIGIEANEEYCEKAAERLAQPDLFGGAA